MKQKITLNWQTTASSGMMGPMHDMAKRVSERTNGEVTVEPLPTGAVVNEHYIFQGVQSGLVDIGFTTSGYGKSAGLLPRSAAGELPNWPSGQAGCAFSKAVCDKYVRSDMEALGVTPLFYEINMATNFDFFVPPYATDIYSNKVYASLDDVKGARILSQHKTASDALALIGAVPVEIPYAEISAAFSNDTIDGALMSSFGLMALGGCKDHIKGCLRIGFPQSEDAFTFMNKKTYDSLHADFQYIITDEIRNFWKLLDRSKIIKLCHAIRDEMVQTGKLKVIELTPSEQAWCDQQWEQKLVEAWIKRQVPAGLKDARSYWEDLKKLQADILASGIPQCEDERLR